MESVYTFDLGIQTLPSFGAPPVHLADAHSNTVGIKLRPADMQKISYRNIDAVERIMSTCTLPPAVYQLFKQLVTHKQSKPLILLTMLLDYG